MVVNVSPPTVAAASPAPLLHLRGITRRYGKLCALDNVSLVVPPGPVGLVGNNGAGKSTLLKILLGLLTPNSGSGEILGHSLSKARGAPRAMVGYMPEAAALVPMLKGVEYVALSGALYGMPRMEARRRAHELLDYVGLGELRYRPLADYSVGAVQRLKLAAALVHDPRLLLLDEPTNGLDPDGRESMLRLLSDLIAQTGKSVILCTHILTDVQRFCRHGIVLHRGKVVWSGSLSEIAAPAVQRYHLVWRGTDGFVMAMRASGMDYSPDGAPDRGHVQFAPGQSTRQLFELAVEKGAVISRLVPALEDLQSLFFRLTQGQRPAAETPGAETRPPAHQEVIG